MKIGFLILAHRYPTQLENLIHSLLTFPDASVYVHIDQKSEELYKNISEIFSGTNQVVFLQERYSVYWGSFNQIQATFALIKKAVERKHEDYFMLLSGQDFLIKKPETLIQFFTENKGKQFLVNFQLPDSQWKDGGLNRLAYYSIDIDGHPWFTNKVNTLIERLHRYSGFKRKTKFQQYGGSNWFNLDFNAMKYIVQFINSNPEFYKSFKYTRCADEIFIQSILMNSNFASQVVSDDLRFIDWSSGPEYPRILRSADLDRMVHAKHKFFGRKFDSTVDAKILDELSQYIRSEPQIN